MPPPASAVLLLLMVQLVMVGEAHPWQMIPLSRLFIIAQSVIVGEE
jgi:hypothetical protein